MLELSAFDLDHTLIRGNCSASFCRYLFRQKVIPLSQIMQSFFYSLRHRFLGMSLFDLHHTVFDKVLLGKPLGFLEGYIDKFVEEYVKEALYMPAFLRLKRAQQLGHYTMILSNSPSFLVERFAKILKVHSFYATEYSVDENRCFHKIKKILEGKDKAQLIRHISKKLGIFLHQITTYSDSFLDLEFLEAGGKPIAVNPDKKLRAISIEKQWSII